MTTPPFTITNESVTVVWQGKPITVQRGAANFLGIRSAIIEERWDDIGKHITIGKSLSEWAKGRYTVSGDIVSFDGKVIPNDINERLRQMAARGEDPAPVFAFWAKLQKNPSWRSVQQLWPFLKHQGIPLTADGCFLAYKMVTSDLKDVHSGQFDNTPGKILEMPRNEISDDPNKACHIGFHVGARSYASDFHNGKMLICKVDPADVICIPYDASQRKMRVCKYEVIGHDNGEYMSSTTIKDQEIGTRFGASVSEEDNDEDSDEDPPFDDADDDVEIEDDDADDDVEIEDDDVDELDPDNKIGEAMDREFAAGTIDRTGNPLTKVEKKAAKKGFSKFDKLDAAGLMGSSIEDLRKYAGKGLDIVGSSKIPGGKATLVAKILEVRK